MQQFSAKQTARNILAVGGVRLFRYAHLPDSGADLRKAVVVEVLAEKDIVLNKGIDDVERSMSVKGIEQFNEVYALGQVVTVHELPEGQEFSGSGDDSPKSRLV